MADNNNSEIMKSLFMNIVIIHIVILGISFLIWMKWIKPNKRIWTIMTLMALFIYLFYSFKLIFKILIIKDLSIGGYTFAFEMMSFIYDVIFFITLVMLAIFPKIIAFKKTPHSNV